MQALYAMIEQMFDHPVPGRLRDQPDGATVGRHGRLPV
jgi:hypothetical protein